MIVYMNFTSLFNLIFYFYNKHVYTPLGVRVQQGKWYLPLKANLYPRINNILLIVGYQLESQRHCPQIHVIL